jgi:NAD(P) transhydrogenase subunit alpha
LKLLRRSVKNLSIRSNANEQAQSLGARIVDLGIPEGIAVSEDRKHANNLPKEWLEKEREAIKDIVSKSDIVFCSALVPGRLAPILITEEMVKSMQPGSCIVDVSIDQGGNCELTVPGEKIVKHGVIIEGIKNIPGLLPTSSTWMFAHNIYNLLEYLTVDGKIKLDLNDEITSSILVTYEGKVVHTGALEAMDLIGT